MQQIPNDVTRKIKDSSETMIRQFCGQLHDIAVQEKYRNNKIDEEEFFRGLISIMSREIANEIYSLCGNNNFFDIFRSTKWHHKKN